MTHLRQQAALNEALGEIDLRIHSGLAFDDIMRSALEGFVAALKADGGHIEMIEGDEWVIRYETGRGTDMAGVRLSAAEAPIATSATRLQRPLAIADCMIEDSGVAVGFPLRHGLRGVVALPLFVHGEVTGCLLAWMCDAPRTFTDVEIGFARRMAASLALALENARLIEAERAIRTRAETAEAQLAEELGRSRVLLRAADELAAATSPDILLERLADIVREATGISRTFINLIDVGRRTLSAKIATGGLVKPAGPRIRFENLSETALSAIMARQTCILDYELPGTPEADRQIASANSARLVLFVPLLYRGEIIGHISMDEPGVRYEFTPEQIRIVNSIAAQAAVALNNARLYEREHRIAETLQQAILQPPEIIPGLAVAYEYRPASATANVGGDFYDVFAVDDRRVALMIGDVAGKGIEAARLTNMLRDGARAYLLEDAAPDAVLVRLNALMYRFTPAERFATVFLGILDRFSGALEYVSAAHPMPLISSNGSVRALDDGDGLLGAFPEMSFTARHTTLRPGDTLVMYTDGITEARDGSALFGEDGVADTLARLADVALPDLPEALLERVLSFAHGHLRDDVVILCAALERG